LKQEKSDYRSIFKNTSLLGGVQIIIIIIAIVRSKFSALLIGPTGMGVIYLITSTTGFIGTLTNFGLGTIAIKNIAKANATNNQSRVSKVVKTFNKLVWITGILGSICVMVLSPWLSQITFGNSNYTLAFCILSVTLLLAQLNTGHFVVLQGLRQFKNLALSNLFAGLLILLCTVPILYFFKIEGVVFSILMYSLIPLIISWLFTRNIQFKEVIVSNQRLIQQGKELFFLGFTISLTRLMPLGATLLINAYVSNLGGVAQVGLFTAGFSIISTYTGMIFTAMETEYFSRLSSLSSLIDSYKKAINQQLEIAFLLICPIINLFLVFIHWGIVILYSNEFTQIDEMMRWAALGLMFKAIAWPMGYLLLVKEDSKLFFINEALANIFLVILNVIFYKFLGITGLGISFLISCLINLIQIFSIINFKYKFKFEKEFGLMFIIQFLVTLSCFLSIYFIKSSYNYYLSIPFAFISIFYSYRELDKKMQIGSLIKNKLGVLIVNKNGKK
jgi:O-antigen/teichoic acid export membrane protein